MNFKTGFAWLAIIAGLIAGGCGRGGSSARDAELDRDLRSSGNLNSAGNMAANRDTSIENNFWVEAAAGGLAEVELGKLTTDHAGSAEVKDFGQMMVADHTAANNELKPIAQQKDIALPTSLDPAHQTIHDRLAGMSGDAFDREFLEVMVDDHQKAVELFQKQEQSASDPDARSFASKTLPVIERHLQAAKSIRASLK